MDVYDTAAIALVWKRLLAKKDDDAAIVRDMLNMEENTEFHNGMMVLPVTLPRVWSLTQLFYGNRIQKTIRIPRKMQSFCMLRLPEHFMNCI